MLELELPRDYPGLLVSVRSAREAEDALAGGADVIDVKEPSRGSLGAADNATIVAVVRKVNGRAPITVAGGELLELGGEGTKKDAIPEPPLGGKLFKLGLAGCDVWGNWISNWRDRVATMGRSARPVAVVYADWRAAKAPPPKEVLNAAVEIGCPALLIDTGDKSAGGLFTHWPADDLIPFLERVRDRGLISVLAGSLAGEAFTAAAQLRPDLVAVRGAACEGNREGVVSSDRVRRLRLSLKSPSASRLC